MKVLQMSEEIFPNQLGGVGKHVYDLSMELIRNGIEVKILVKNLQSRPELYLNDESNKIRDFVIRYKSISDLYKLISTYRFDIVHFHQMGPRPLGYIQNELAQVLAKNIEVKIVNTPHGTLDVLANPPSVESAQHSKILMKIYLSYLKNISLKFVDRLIALSPYQVKLMESLGIPKEKIRLIPNGIPNNSFKSENENTFLNKYDLQDKKILLYVGRLSARKKVSDIINIMPKIIKKYEDVILVVIGPDKGGLEELRYLTRRLHLTEHILFLGKTSEKEKIDALSSACLFINPSEYEAFGIAVLEAMAQKTPVISANNEGARYLLENGKYGFLYEIGDKEELTKCILSLLEDGKKAKEFADKGRKRSEKFRWENIAKEMVNAYGELIK